MAKSIPVKHYHHHYHFSYVTSFKRHFTSIGAVTLLLLLASFVVTRSLVPAHIGTLTNFSILDLITATFFTIFRLIIAYILALIVSVPLALLITSSPKVEKILLPFFDIFQSVPVLAFFPIIVLAFIKFNFYDGAAIFILFMAMVWNLVFNMIGGIKTMPQDIELAAKVFKASGLKKLRYVVLPSIVPYIITGSLLAWAQGWNIMIVAEVLHTYIPQGQPYQDLPGLGSLLVNAISEGQTIVFLATIATVVILIGTINFFVWQRLLHLTEKYKYD